MLVNTIMNLIISVGGVGTCPYWNHAKPSSSCKTCIGIHVVLGWSIAKHFPIYGIYFSDTDLESVLCIYLHLYMVTCLVTCLLTLAHAREGWSACVCVCVCEQVFSRAVSAVGTERGGMDKHHGRSVQQETGAALATERRSPAASYSTGCALIRDSACV